MPSLLVTVFILQLIIHVVNTIGVGVVNTLLWNLYNRLPTPTSKAAADQRQLQKDFLKLRKELAATSAQDEFAKWAKLDRQFNKVREQLEKSNTSLVSTKATFDKFVSTLRWISTNGLRMFLEFWYQKQPIFWLPRGWVPYYAEWLISFPRAPIGSVSVNAWGLACGAVILLVSDAIVAVIGLLVAARSNSLPQAREQPLSSGAARGSGGSSGPGGTSKKEL